MKLHHASEHYAGEIVARLGLDQKLIEDGPWSDVVEIVRQSRRAGADDVINLARVFSEGATTPEAKAAALDALIAQASRDYGTPINDEGHTA